MFNAPINSHPFIGEIADAAFPQIKLRARNTMQDLSLPLTLHAIMPSRIPAGERLAVSYRGQSYASTNQAEIFDAARRCHISTDDCDSDHHLNLTKVFMADRLWNEWRYVPDGWTRLEAVEGFLRPAGVKCLAFTKEKTTLILSNFPNLATWHLSQSIIGNLLPWLFKDHPLTPDEIVLLTALTKKDAEQEYIAAANKLAEPYDFRAAAIRHKLDGYESNFNRIRIEQIRGNEVPRVMREIESLMESLGSWNQKYRQFGIELAGLEATSSENSNELMDYFMSHRSFTLGEVTPSVIKFSISDYLDFVDEDAYDTCIDKMRCGVFTAYSRDVADRTALRNLFAHLWVKHDLKLRTCAGYVLDIAQSLFDGVSHYTFEDSVAATHIPNPHIQEYRCVGNYRPMFRKGMMERDYIGVMEQAIASCKSLNFGDGIVMSNFGGTLRSYRDGSGPRAFELPDGKLMTFKEALEWANTNEDAAKAAQ